MSSETSPSFSGKSGRGDPRGDQRLVIAAQSGCRAAFEELWHLHSKRVYRTIFSITRNAEDAEDALQDAFLRAFLALGRFEGRSNFYSWMTRIAINSALMILRKRRSRHENSLNPAPEWEDEIGQLEVKDLALDPEQTCDQRQQKAKLIRKIHRLPPNLREVVQVRLIEEYSLKETAAKLKISEFAIKSRLYRARLRLGATTSVRSRS